MNNTRWMACAAALAVASVFMTVVEEARAQRLSVGCRCRIVIRAFVPPDPTVVNSFSLQGSDGDVFVEGTRIATLQQLDMGFQAVTPSSTGFIADVASMTGLVPGFPIDGSDTACPSYWTLGDPSSTSVCPNNVVFDNVAGEVFGCVRMNVNGLPDEVDVFIEGTYDPTTGGDLVVDGFTDDFDLSILGIRGSRAHRPVHGANPVHRASLASRQEGDDSPNHGPRAHARGPYSRGCDQRRRTGSAARCLTEPTARPWFDSRARSWEPHLPFPPAPRAALTRRSCER